MISKKRLYQINSSRILQYVRLNRGVSRIQAASVKIFPGKVFRHPLGALGKHKKVDLWT